LSQEIRFLGKISQRAKKSDFWEKSDFSIEPRNPIDFWEKSDFSTSQEIRLIFGKNRISQRAKKSD
jgi:hypothetical protein